VQNGIKKLRVLIGPAIGLVLLILVLRSIKLSEMIQALRSANYLYLLPAVLVLLGSFGVRTLRWKYLLGPLGKKLPIGALWSGFLIGYFSNFALTANAGDLVRAYIVGRRQAISKSATLASIVVERLFDVASLVLLLFAISLGQSLPAWIKLAGLTAGAALVLGCLGLVLLVRYEKLANWAIHGLVGRLLPPAARLIERLWRSFTDGLVLWQRGGEGAWAAALSILAWLVLAVAFFFIGQSLGLTVPPQAYLLLAVVIILGAMVPSLPGRVGTLEFLAVSTLAVFSVPAEPALSFALLLRLVRLAPLGLGYAFLFREGLQLSDISQLARVQEPGE
jgi:uncharacterized protein (TIRG00374 family)